MLNMIRGAALGVLTASAVVIGTSAFAETVMYTADMKGPSEVPATDSAGTGKLDASYDTVTKKLTWTVTYSGLTGPAAMAHFMGRPIRKPLRPSSFRKRLVLKAR